MSGEPEAPSFASLAPTVVVYSESHETDGHTPGTDVKAPRPTNALPLASSGRTPSPPARGGFLNEGSQGSDSSGAPLPAKPNNATARTGALPSSQGPHNEIEILDGDEEEPRTSGSAQGRGSGSAAGTATSPHNNSPSTEGKTQQAQQQQQQQAGSGSQLGAGLSAASAQGNQSGQAQQSANKGQATSSTNPKEKNFRQAVLSFGISNEPALRKEIADRDKLLQDKDKTLQEKDKTISDLQEQLQRLHQQVQVTSEQVNENSKGDDERLQRYQAVMREAMIQQAQTQRRDARRSQHQMHFELGQVSTISGIHGIQEMWVHGNRHRDILIEIQAINQRLSVVEQHKREAQMSKRLTSKSLNRVAKDIGPSSAVVAPNSFCQPLNEQDGDSSHGFAHPLPPGTPGVSAGAHITEYLLAEEMAEIYKLESVQLKAQLEALEQEKLDMESKRVAFLKECRRIEDEDHSTFASRVDVGPKNNPTRYVLLNLLGKGGFGEVWKAFDLLEGHLVALKIHHIDRAWSAAVRETYLRHLDRELKIMQQLEHPRLVPLYDFFELDSRTYVSVMEYCGGTDLDTYLKNHKTLKESDAKLIIKQVISGLRALHELGIIHYDLKPANILFASELSSCMEVKITDFGLSKMVAAEGNSASSEIELTSVGTGTFWYLPPECFSGRKRITNKVDIWAVGVIFYQLLVGRKPFANDESQQSIWENNSITKAVQKGVEWPQDLKVSPGCKQFIKDCLTALPDSRPDIGQLSSHPYLMGERKRPRALMEVVSGPGTATGGSQVFEAGLAPPVAPPLRHREGGPM